jgi:gliding motility-associated-like protein
MMQDPSLRLRHIGRATLPLAFAVCSALAQFSTVAQPQVTPSMGKQFWLGFLQGYQGGDVAYLEVFVSSYTSTTGTISMPLLGFEQSFTVTANEVTTITFPSVGIAMHQGSEFVDEKGILIETEDTVAVVAINFEQYTADATVVYPTNALGTEYRISTYRGTITGLPSEFLIVATEDDTEVEITTPCNTEGGQQSGIPWTVQLDRGESYQVKAVGVQDLTGATVVGTENSGSCRPFAVFSGVACVNVGACSACDHIYEQNLPTSVWGTSYFTAPFRGLIEYVYRVVANEDGTLVSANGGPPVALDAGEFFEATVEEGVHFTGNLPFAVAQFMVMNCQTGQGDPALLLVNSEDQRIPDITFSTVESTVIQNHSVSIVVPNTSVAGVFLDGAALPAADFTPYADGSPYSYGEFAINEGSHTLQCAEGISAYVYGLGSAETYAYSVGSFNPVPPPDIENVTCVDSLGQLIALASPASLFDPYWTTQDAPEDTLAEGLTYTFNITENNVYVVTGNSNLSGCQESFYFSVELREPPDFVMEVNGTTTGELAVCANVPVGLNANLVSPGVWTYAWEPADLVAAPQSATTLAYPVEDTWFSVTVASLSGLCAFEEDSVLVRVLPSDLLGVAAMAEPERACSGTNTQLQVQVLQALRQDPLDTQPNSMWSAVEGGIISDVCGSFVGQALYFDGAGERYATTVPLNMSGGGRLRFALKIAGAVAPCDNAEVGEDVVVEYSVNGGADWLLMATYSEAAYPAITILELELPAGAQTPATAFRWRQLANSGAGQDNWVLDQVAIGVYDLQGFQYAWTPGALVSDSTAAEPTAVLANDAQYTLTVRDGSCTASALVELTIDPTPIFDLGPDQFICLPDTGFFALQDSLGQFLWHTGSTDTSFLAFVTDTVRLTVTDGPCSATDAVVVTVEQCELEIVMPNVFTPNGDENNGVFVPVLLKGVRDLEFTVYNRWGNEVWRTTNKELAWQGKDAGGSSVSEGTYYWVLNYNTLLTNEAGSRRGVVDLLR